MIINNIPREEKDQKAAGTKKKKKRGWVILIIVAAIIILGTINVLSKKDGKIKVVKVVTVEPESIPQEVSANGEIGSRENIAIVSKISGSIKKVFVEEGSHLAKGDPIVFIDDEQILVQQKSAIATLESTRRSVKGELLSLRSAYNQAKNNYEKARRDIESIKQLHTLGSASDEQLTEAEDSLSITENAYQSALQNVNFREGRSINDPRISPIKDDELIIEASVEVKQAVANLNAITSNLSDCDIRAGMNGIVSELKVEEGAMVSSGMMIGKLHNPDLLEVSAYIDEVDISSIKLGQEAKIESDSFIGRQLTGEVTFIAPVIQRVGDSRVCRIEVSFMDPDNEAKVGASCSIYIIVKQTENSPAIPIEAYLQEKNKKYVYKLVEKDNTKTIEKTEIETGLIGIDKVEVVSGLEMGDEIVKEDLKMLTSGTVVKAKREQNDTAK